MLIHNFDGPKHTNKTNHSNFIGFGHSDVGGAHDAYSGGSVKSYGSCPVTGNKAPEGVEPSNKKSGVCPFVGMPKPGQQ